VQESSPSKRTALLKRRAVYWLAQREHSRLELQRKLSKVAQEAFGAQAQIEAFDLQAEIDEVINRLEAQHYLSDQRFIQSRVRLRQAKFGNQRIEHELAEHGLTIGETDAKALKVSELARAREVWQRKFGAVANTPQVKAKQIRFLAGRGFNLDVIYQLLKTIDD
jgi:regulatory protein